MCEPRARKACDYTLAQRAQVTPYAYADSSCSTIIDLQRRSLRFCLSAEISLRERVDSLLEDDQTLQYRLIRKVLVRTQLCPFSCPDPDWCLMRLELAISGHFGDIVT
jgi:hypothetical protein